MQLVTRVSSTLPRYQSGKKATTKLSTPSSSARIVIAFSESTQQHLQPLRVYAPNDDTGGRLEAEVQIRPGSHIYKVSLRKPLGLTLVGEEGQCQWCTRPLHGTMVAGHG